MNSKSPYYFSSKIIQINRISFHLQVKINQLIQIYNRMSQIKNGTQLIDKTTRNRIFNSRYWKEQCFALNAETLIDKAIKIKCVGGLYGGAKKPTKFLCLVFKMLQMNMSRDIVMVYLGERDYKYLNAMALVYLRLTVKAPQIYLLLEPFYIDNRKLRVRDSIGRYQITYVDQFVDDLLSQQIFIGLAFPFVPKRLALQLQGVIDARKNLIEEEINDQLSKKEHE